MRLLLDPDPNASGGNTPATPEVTKAETPATPPTPPTPPAPPAPNPLAADLAAARARLAELEHADAERERVAREAEEEKLRNKGEFEKLIKQRDEQLNTERKKAAEAVERSKTYALKSAFFAELGKYDLVEGSAEDLYELWHKQFETVADGDGWTTRSPDGRPLADVINERLTSARYSNHVKAQSRSGSGGGNGQVPAPTPNSTPAAPTDPFERGLKAVIAHNRIGAPGLAGNYGNN